MRERALTALEFVGFRHFANRAGDALSFGQQRIIEIARTLIHEPKVVLLDEPAVGAVGQPGWRSSTSCCDASVTSGGVTLVMIEHVIRLVMGVSDRVVVLNSGRKIAEGAAGRRCGPTRPSPRRTSGTRRRGEGRRTDARGTPSQRLVRG